MAFTRRLLGYDQGQVDAAVTKLTFDAAEAAQDAERLIAELERQRLSIDELRQDHDQLSHALVSAHKAAQDIRAAAELHAQDVITEAGQRADATVREAEVNARAMIMEARQRADAMVREAEDAVRIIEAEIDTLLRRRRDAEQSYAAFVESVVKTFDNSRVSAKPSLTAFP